VDGVRQRDGAVMWSPSFVCVVRDDGEREYRVGHELVDEFLEFVAGRARPNTVRAYAHDLKVFFTVVAKEPAEVTPRDVLGFVAAQQRPRAGAENVVRLSEGGAGLSAATIKRRLAAVSSLFGYLVIRGDVGVAANPVPGGLPTRQSRRHEQRGVPLVRGVRRLPRILNSAEVTALLGALRTDRDRAMIEAMLLGGLRRCEVLGLRLEDLRLGENRLFIAQGKGGHERLVPISATFLSTVADYLNRERPADASTDRLFVVLKGPTRGRPLSSEGLDEVLAGARGRAGLTHGICHELRHTCFTRLREAGMAIEAVQAQAGHRSIASTRIYLHLGDDWLAEQYHRAAEAIDAQAAVETEVIR
jgi:integrase/recombinase XerD